MKALNCPGGHGPLEPKKLMKQKAYKGVDIEYPADALVCPECGLEAGTVESAGKVQRAMADAYREKMGLLTSSEIKSLRKAKDLTQQQLAELMKVGIASIKRWETGLIQSESMDLALRISLQQDTYEDINSGNREISLPRIKLVAVTFERIIGKRLLKVGDKFLFLAKYLWYADMLAFRKLGKGLTGASYAALPYGPQLNNYNYLVRPIKASNENDAEPLNEDEQRIITRVATTFPEEQAVYEAAHREKIWEETPNGALMPYSLAHDLTEI